jgi:signal transduction histidine kinase
VKGKSVAETHLAELLYAERIRLLYRQMPLSLVVNAVNAIIVALIVIPLVGAHEPLIWASLLIAVTFGRALLWQRYSRITRRIDDARLWARQATIGTGLAGLLWGLGAAILPGDSGTAQMFLSFTIGGMCVGSVAVASVHLPALLAYILPASLPLVTRFLIQGTPIGAAMAGMALIFIVALFLSGKNLNHSLSESLRLQFDVEDRTRELAAVNMELARQTIELSQSRDAAQAANRLKSQFLTNMSHELRTPLNAIIGFSELMTTEVMRPLKIPEYRSYAADILSSGRHLLEIVNDILDVSKLEAGSLLLDREPVDLTELVEFCRRMVEARAADAGVSLVASVPQYLSISADKTLLTRIMLNLMSNAVKFTPREGRIEINAFVQNGGWIELAVADTGIGMTAAETALAVLPFQQVDGSLARRHEGTGLGLPLAKGLAELHGGTLTIESVPGRGTTVQVRLPAV